HADAHRQLRARAEPRLLQLRERVKPPCFSVAEIEGRESIEGVLRHCGSESIATFFSTPFPRLFPRARARARSRARGGWVTSSLRAARPGRGRGRGGGR